MYETVNQALVEVLLDGRFDAQPLYVVLDNQARRELARALGQPGIDVEAFCCRVVGESLASRGDPYARHAEIGFKWFEGGCVGPPPFTAILFTLAHAAECMAASGEYTAGNYYKRLEELTGVAASRLSQFGISTEKFWLNFNRWLGATDYRYGRPTAKQSGGFVYVSLATSQAIIRAADRECFHHLFKKYGFSSTDTVAVGEMAEYIALWIRSSAASPRLKAAWQRKEQQQRICEIAIAELDEWSRERPARAPGAEAAVLSLVAAIIPSLARPRLSLLLGRRADVATDVALSAAGGAAVTLSNSHYGSFATLSPPHVVDVAQALRSGISLSGAGGSLAYRWTPRLVIPFSRSESGPYWAEANRTTIGVEHLVLVRSDPRIKDPVEAVLAEAAAPGYTAATAEHMPGIPAGWILYEGVRLLRVASDVPKEAAALAPVAASAQLATVGGVQLSRGIWHCHAPPTFELAAGEGESRIEVFEGPGEGAPIASMVANGPACLALRSDQVPASGSVFVRASTQHRDAGTFELLLRSAARPRPLDRHGAGRLAYNDITTAGPIGDASGVVVEGLSVHPPVGLPQGLSVDKRFTSLDKGGEAEDVSPPLLEARQIARPQVARDDVNALLSLACGERGFHVWHCETVPPQYPLHKPVNMECPHCGLAVVARHRGGNVARTARPATRAPIPPPSVRPAPEGNVDHNLLLDALCFLGSGTWSVFEAVAGQFVDQPWTAIELARDLVALGHLDVSRKPGSGRIAAWSIAGPTLAFSGLSTAHLAGFRNEALVGAVMGRAHAAGARAAVDSPLGQPKVIRIQGLGPAEAAAAFGDIEDCLGRGLRISGDAPGSIAAACLAAPGLDSLLRPISAGSPKQVEQFDPGKGHWRNIEAIAGPGAYRFQYTGQTYVYRSLAGEDLEGPHEIVKLFAARDARATLHAYDPSSMCFTSVLGCEPPGLLRRALAACTGELAQLAPGGRVVAKGVPEPVAAAILDILYPGG